MGIFEVLAKVVHDVHTDESGGGDRYTYSSLRATKLLMRCSIERQKVITFMLWVRASYHPKNLPEESRTRTGRWEQWTNATKHEHQWPFPMAGSRIAPEQ